MTKAEIVKQLIDIRDNFTEVIVELKKNPDCIDTETLNLIDCINSLSVEI